MEEIITAKFLVLHQNFQRNKDDVDVHGMSSFVGCFSRNDSDAAHVWVRCDDPNQASHTMDSSAAPHDLPSPQLVCRAAVIHLPSVRIPRKQS